MSYHENIVLFLIIILPLLYPIRSEDVCLTPECVQIAGDILAKSGSKMQSSPCQDMNQYACSAYSQLDNLPANKILRIALADPGDKVAVRLKNIMEEPFCICDDVETSAETKARLYYQSCLNNTDLTGELRDYIREHGSWPLEPDWTPDIFDFERSIIDGNNYGQESLILFGIERDRYNATVYTLLLLQSGLWFEPSELYLGNASETVRQEYVESFVNLTKEIGYNEENKSRTLAEDLWQFEKSLASIQEQTIELAFQPITIMTLDELDMLDVNMSPGVSQFNETLDNRNASMMKINFTRLFSLYTQQDLSGSSQVSVFTPNYIKNINSILYSTSLETLAMYTMFCKFRKLLPLVSAKFNDGKERTWSECSEKVKTDMMDAVSALYAKKFISPEDKKNIEELAYDLLDYFQTNSVDQVNWLDPETKARAKDKAANMLVLIAYPEFILDEDKLDSYYESLEISNGSYFKNIVNIKFWLYGKEVEKYERYFYDRSAWSESILAVNAKHVVNSNVMQVFSGIMQPPFYHQNYPKSLLYGTAGVIIGHEIFHGFDNTGKNYDEVGSRINWWINSSAMAFTERTECFIEQYDNIRVGFGYKNNGTKTLDENIADNGGLALAYGAYLRWLSKNNDPALLKIYDPLLPGLDLTRQQLFFMAAAQLFCGTNSKAGIEYLLGSDVHSISRARINGFMMNSHEFAEAFNCRAANPMNPVNKCKIW